MGNRVSFLLRTALDSNIIDERHRNAKKLTVNGVKSWCNSQLLGLSQSARLTVSICHPYAQGRNIRQDVKSKRRA